MPLPILIVVPSNKTLKPGDQAIPSKIANNIKVVLSSILPVYDYPWRPGLEPVAKIAEVNNWLKTYAEENDHVYLDYFPALANEQQGMKKEYASDGVHPTDAGYKVMEPLVKEAIEKALKQ